MAVKQEDDESLGNYTKRFSKEVRLVSDPNPSVLINAYISGLRMFGFF